jgi:hypothetical protein
MGRIAEGMAISMKYKMQLVKSKWQKSTDITLYTLFPTLSAQRLTHRSLHPALLIPVRTQIQYAQPGRLP